MCFLVNANFGNGSKVENRTKIADTVLDTAESGWEEGGWAEPWAKKSDGYGYDKPWSQSYQDQSGWLKKEDDPPIWKWGWKPAPKPDHKPWIKSWEPPKPEFKKVWSPWGQKVDHGYNKWNPWSKKSDDEEPEPKVIVVKQTEDKSSNPWELKKKKKPVYILVRVDKDQEEAEKDDDDQWSKKKPWQVPWLKKK